MAKSGRMFSWQVEDVVAKQHARLAKKRAAEQRKIKRIEKQLKKLKDAENDDNP